MQSQETLFVGEFTHAVDAQRRIAVPKEWRCKDGDSLFYVLPGRHKTLQLMPYDSFRQLAEQLRKVSINDPKASMALAKLGARAKECRCDKQGRIQIPEQLLEYAEIKKENVVDSELLMIGAFTNIQIWSKENWSKQSMGDDEMLDAVQKIEEMGI